MLSALVTTEPTQASGLSAVDGLGTQSCSAVVQARSDDRTKFVGFAAWMTGFISAANGYEPDTFDLTPWQSPEFAMAQVMSSCQKQPEASFASVVASYVKFLYPNRLQAESKLVAVRNKDQKVFLYLNVLERTRSRLEELGYQTGNGETAEFSQPFRDALFNFQIKEKLNPSGLPDLVTLARLLS